MSQLSASHRYVHKRFHEVFGPPDTALGREDHWSLKPTPNGMSINVLVDGSAEAPAVWVFDPHVKDDGVMRKTVQGEDDLNDIIKQIQDRVKHAAQRPGHA